MTKKKKNNTLNAIPDTPKKQVSNKDTAIETNTKQPAASKTAGDLDLKNKEKSFQFLKLGIPILLIVVILFLTVGKPVLHSFKKSKLRKMNVILITIDTLRADYVSAYNQAKADTPNLDELAGNGTLFEHCITQTPLTLPSHTTILSGTYPTYHQVRDNGGYVVPEKLDFVSEILKKNGFKTSAFIGAYVLHSKWGMNQGFDTYSDYFDVDRSIKVKLQNDKRADTVLTDAKKWLHENKEDRFFSWIHLYDPHTPYSPPAPYDEKFASNPYRGEVEYVDEQLGLFFEFLKSEGLDSNTLLIVTADHGESLGEYGEPEHGFFIYEPTVRVPLIIKAPFAFPAERIVRTVGLVDLAPTILDAVSIAIPSSYQGQSLLNDLFGKGQSPDHEAYTETYYPRIHFGWSELKGLYANKMKYIQAPEEELFDLTNDPAEKNNLVLKKSFDKQKMKEKMDAFLKDKSRNYLSVSNSDSIDSSDLKRLQALGYVTTTADTSKDEILPDPKSKVGVIADFLKAVELNASGQIEESITVINTLIEKDPMSSDAYSLLGSTYMSANNYQAAMEKFYKVLELKPSANFTMLNILICLEKMEKYDTFISEGEKFLKVFPNDPALCYRLGLVYLKKNDNEKALSYLEKSVQNDQTNYNALIKLGEIHLLSEDAEKAVSYLEKAISLKPDAEKINLLMAQTQDVLNNPEKANTFYKKELELNPKSVSAAFSIASNLKKAGKMDEAIPYYRKAIEIDPKLNMPYVLIAEHYLNTNQKLDEAIELCKTAITLEPYDNGTMMGYFILTNIYGNRGDKENLEIYTKKGDELYRQLQKNR